MPAASVDGTIESPNTAWSEIGVGLEVAFPVYPFERFTEKAKRVLTLAQDEAEKAHHSYIGSEHLLLGLMRQGDGLGAQVLYGLGLEIEQVRATIDSVLGRNERIRVQQIIPTSRVKKIIEIAFEEAKRMNNRYVGTEHLLLGLLIEGEGIAAHVLEDLGANLDKVRHELDSLLKEQSPEEGSPADQPGRPAARFLNPPSQSFLPRRHGYGDLDRLTSESTSALALAEEEAVKAGVGYVGPEHLLVGLVRQAEGSAGQALLALGVDLKRVRRELAKKRSSSPPLAVQAVIPTPRLHHAVGVVARQEADQGPTGRVDTQHLLLAITAEESDQAVKLLRTLKVDVAALREQLSKLGAEPPT
ncbi:MAG: Clp protease N-terminal domain-containing protein [Candidatus Dormiibacterota bacterium]